MGGLPTLSGQEVANVFVRGRMARQRGSHMILVKNTHGATPTPDFHSARRPVNGRSFPLSIDIP